MDAQAWLMFQQSG